VEEEDEDEGEKEEGRLDDALINSLYRLAEGE
jgi:hypothetical protein